MSVGRGTAVEWRTVPGEIADIKLGKMLDRAKHTSGRKLTSMFVGNLPFEHGNLPSGHGNLPIRAR